MADPTPTTAPSSYTPAPSPVRQYLETYRREYPITLRVLRAFPPEQAALKPHERSASALQLAWSFVVEQRLLLLAVRGEEPLGGGFPPPPDRWDEVLTRFEEQHEEVVREIEQRGDALLQGTTQFLTGPKQIGEYRLMDFLWFLLHDQIHHRGQLSVYVRLAGGRVPSIYGPSADEPWT